MLVLKENVAQRELSMIQSINLCSPFSCFRAHEFTRCVIVPFPILVFFSCRLLTPRWRPCVKRQRHGFVSLDNVDMIFVGIVP